MSSFVIRTALSENTVAAVRFVLARHQVRAAADEVLRPEDVLAKPGMFVGVSVISLKSFGENEANYKYRQPAEGLVSVSVKADNASSSVAGLKEAARVAQFLREIVLDDDLVSMRAFGNGTQEKIWMSFYQDRVMYDDKRFEGGGGPVAIETLFQTEPFSY